MTDDSDLCSACAEAAKRSDCLHGGCPWKALEKAEAGLCRSDGMPWKTYAEQLVYEAEKAEAERDRLAARCAELEGALKKSVTRTIRDLQTRGFLKTAIDKDRTIKAARQALAGNLSEIPNDAERQP